MPNGGPEGVALRRARAVAGIDMAMVMKVVGECFGVSGPRMEEFNSTGRRRLTSTHLCPNKTSGGGEPVFRFVIYASSDGGKRTAEPFDRWLVDRRSTPTHVSTLSRMAYMLYRMGDDERVAALAAGVGPECARLLGIPASDRLSFEAAGGRVLNVDALEFLRRGFLPALMHVTGVPTKKTRQAITGRGRGSLVSAAKAYATRHLGGEDGAALREEVDRLDFAWDGLLRSASDVFFLGTRPKRPAIPTAFDVLALAYSMDRWPEPGKTPRMRMVLAFLGMAFMCGFRTGQVSVLRNLGFQAPDSGSYVTVARTGTNRVGGVYSLRSRSSKVAANTYKDVPLPGWLGAWLEDWDAVRSPSPDHTGMFLTRSGGSICPTVLEGAAPSSRKSRVDEVFAVMREVVRDDMGGDSAGVLKGLTCYTQLRAIFFNSVPESEDGSLLDLLGRADAYLAGASTTPEPAVVIAGRRLVLPSGGSGRVSDRDNTVKQLANLNESSVDQMKDAYSEKVLDSIDALIPRLSAVKDYLWAELDAQAATTPSRDSCKCETRQTSGL